MGNEGPTKEELEKMSPEQIKEYEEQNCLFCHIVKGKVTSQKVYEDDVCIGILDINPSNPGHVLIIPKKHYTIMPMIKEEEYSKIIITAKKISTAILRAVKAEGINMFIANGQVAGQKSPHTMIHLIPRREGDHITAFDLPKNKIEPEDQDKLRRLIRRKMNELFGIEEKEEKTGTRSPSETNTTKPEPQKNNSPEDKKKADLDRISKIFKG